MKMRTFYKSIVALVALMAMQVTTAWAGDVTTLYEKTLTGGTAWVSTDIAEGKWVANANCTGTIGETGLKATTNAGGKMAAELKYTSIISRTKDIVKYTIVWNTGKCKLSYGTANYLQIGNTITIIAVR